MRNAILKGAAIAALAAFALPAMAADTKPGQAQAKASTSQNGQEEKLVCKRLETSGTRMVEKTCLTKEQWKAVEDEAR